MTKKDQIIQKVAESKSDIKRFGVKNLGVFGSYAKENARIDSDIDFLVEFKPKQKTFDNYVDLKFLLEDLFEKEVDLVIHDAIRPELRDTILNEVEYVERL